MQGKSLPRPAQIGNRSDNPLVSDPRAEIHPMLLPAESLNQPLPLPQALLHVAASLVDGQIATGQPMAASRPYNWQAIRALAYLPTQPEYRNRLEQYGEGLRSLFVAIRDQKTPPDNRQTGHLAETYAILKATGRLAWTPGIEELLLRGAGHLREKLESYADLTHFTSSNLGTGTNHGAVYLASLYRVGRLLDRPQDCELALSVGRRLMQDQHPDGYWVETTGGPSVLYNHLTAACAGRMARWTGEAIFEQAMRRAADFQRRMSYPDGTDVETVDGRCRYHALPMAWGGFIHTDTPAGRGYLQNRLQTFVRRYQHVGFHSHGGEHAALFCEDHALWIDGPTVPATPARVDTLGAPAVHAVVRREGPWCFTLNGLSHLPRGWGNFTIDRSSLFSLWHANCGLIVNGSGEPGPTPAQSFQFQAEDTVRYAIPETVHIETEVAGDRGNAKPARLVAEYRGGTGRLEVACIEKNECLLRVSAATRIDRYPVRFTLQLELHAGDWVNGVPLSAEPRRLEAAALAGRVDTGHYAVHFPAGCGEFQWPHNPYNPYDLEHHRSDPEMLVALLSFELKREPLTIRFQMHG